MFSPRAMFCAVVVLGLSAFAAADIDSNSARMGRSVLLTPVRTLEADFSLSSTATDFRPLRNEDSTPFEEVENVSSGGNVSVANVAGRHSRPSASFEDIEMDITRPDRALRAPVEQAPVAPVPEPASLALIGSGLFGLGLMKRKKK